MALSTNVFAEEKMCPIIQSLALRGRDQGVASLVNRLQNWRDREQ